MEMAIIINTIIMLESLVPVPNQVWRNAPLLVITAILMRKSDV